MATVNARFVMKTLMDKLKSFTKKEALMFLKQLAMEYMTNNDNDDFSDEEIIGFDLLQQGNPEEAISEMIEKLAKTPSLSEIIQQAASNTLESTIKTLSAAAASASSSIAQYAAPEADENPIVYYSCVAGFGVAFAHTIYLMVKELRAARERDAAAIAGASAGATLGATPGATAVAEAGRAGRFGTEGLAIAFVSSASDSNVLNKVQGKLAKE